MRKSGFQIELVFPSDHGFTDAQASLIEAAAARWEEVIVGDLSPVSIGMWDARSPYLDTGDVIDDVRIVFKMEDLGGQTNFTIIRGGAYSPLVRKDTHVPYFGEIHLNSQYFASSEENIYSTALHEIGHTLGMYPTRVWQPKKLVEHYSIQKVPFFDSWIVDNSVRFVGPAAIREYNAIFAGFDFVPLETEPTPGSYGSHWNKSAFGGSNEVMIFDSKVPVISRITVAMMEDIGHRVNYSAADWYNPWIVRDRGESEGGDDLKEIWEEWFLEDPLFSSMDVLPYELTIRPDDYEDTEPVVIRKNDTIAGLTIHDPDAFDDVGTKADTFSLTLKDWGSRLHYVSVIAENPEASMIIRLFNDVGQRLRSVRFG